MTALALVFYAAFLALAFGWRTWRQYRETGDHGFRGFSGSSSLEVLAGLLFTAALIAFAIAPVAALLGVMPVVPLPPAATAAGVALALAGFGLVLLAQGQMGASWRIGVSAAERTDLVRHGVFAHVRNPIFTGMGICAVGMLVWVPNGLSLVGAIVGGIGLELQVRAIEEPYLLRSHGTAYADYAHEVGRFLPGVGRLHRDDVA